MPVSFAPARGLRALVVALGAAAAPAAAQTTTIGTSVGNNLVAAGRAAGDATTFTTLAQSFVAPTAACPAATCFLQTFAFFLGDGFAGPSTRFRAYVFNFGADRALTGPALWRSAEFAGSGNVFGLDPFRFDTPNLALARGGSYALVLSASEPFARVPEGATVLAGATLADEYAGGALFGAITGADLSALGEPGVFTRVAGAPDLSFQATFTAAVIPEPGTVLLVGGGLLVLAAAARRRRGERAARPARLADERRARPQVGRDVELDGLAGHDHQVTGGRPATPGRHRHGEDAHRAAGADEVVAEGEALDLARVDAPQAARVAAVAHRVDVERPEVLVRDLERRPRARRGGGAALPRRARGEDGGDEQDGGEAAESHGTPTTGRVGGAVQRTGRASKSTPGRRGWSGRPGAVSRAPGRP